MTHQDLQGRGCRAGLSSTLWLGVAWLRTARDGKEGSLPHCRGVPLTCRSMCHAGVISKP